MKSLYKNKILKPRVKSNNYLIVSLYKNNIDKKFYIHRLVAEAYIPNPENKLQVNHKDFNKANNTIENLEWVTRTENIRHYKESNKWNETIKKKNRKLVSKILNRVKEYKDEIISLYRLNYSIDDISKKLNIGRDFTADVLEIFDFI